MMMMMMMWTCRFPGDPRCNIIYSNLFVFLCLRRRDHCYGFIGCIVFIAYVSCGYYTGEASVVQCSERWTLGRTARVRALAGALRCGLKQVASLTLLRLLG